MLFMCSLADDLDLEEFQLAIEESKLQTSIQCTPIPGKFNQQHISTLGHMLQPRLCSYQLQTNQTTRMLKKTNVYTKSMHTSQNLH